MDRPAANTPDWFAAAQDYVYDQRDWSQVAMTFPAGSSQEPQTYGSIFGKYVMDQWQHSSKVGFQTKSDEFYLWGRPTPVSYDL